MTPKEPPPSRPLPVKLRRATVDPPGDGKSETRGAAYRPSKLREYRLHGTEWWGEGDRRRAFGLWESEGGDGWYVQTIDADTGLPQWETHEALLDDARKAAQDYAESWTRKLVEAVSVAEYRSRAHGQSKGGQAKKHLPGLVARIRRYLAKFPNAKSKEIWQALKLNPPEGFYFDNGGRLCPEKRPGRGIIFTTFRRYVTEARKKLRKQVT